jgi:hypothetical protein
MDNKFYFNGKDDGLSIEEYIKNIKSLWGNQWRYWVRANLMDDASIWWNGVKFEEIHALSDK